MTRPNRARARWTPGAAWLLTPALLFFGLCFLLPIVRMVEQSFGAKQGLLGNYERLISASAYSTSFSNSFEIALSVALLCFGLSYPAAIMLTSASKTLRTAFSTIIILPNFIAALIRTYALMVVLARQGPLNQLLVRFGLFDAPQQLLFNRVSVVVAMTLVLLPIGVLPLANVLGRLDTNLNRAAQVLGASPLASFWRVTFPLSLPGSLTGFVLVFVLALGFFITPALIGGPRDRVIAMDIAQQAKLLTSPGFTEALGVALLVCTLAVLVALSRFMRLDLIWNMAADLSTGAAAGRKRGTWSLPARISQGLANEIGWPLLRLLTKVPLWVGPLCTRTVAICIGACVVVPIAIVVQISFTQASYVSYPPEVYSARWYWELFSNREWFEAIRNSLMVGVMTALLSVVLGATAAIGLARGDIRHKHAVAAFLLSPLIVPSVVGALAFYWMLLKINVAGTVGAVVAAHTLGAVPLVALIVVAAIQTLDRRLEDAAASLGATRWRTFTHVTLPLLGPSLVVAVLFAFLYSMDELVYTLFVRGPAFQTIPIKVWSDLNYGISPLLAVISTLEIVMVVLVVGIGTALTTQYSARSRHA